MMFFLINIVVIQKIVSVYFAISFKALKIFTSNIGGHSLNACLTMNSNKVLKIIFSSQ